MRHEIRRRVGRYATLVRTPNDRRGEGMLRQSLDTGDETQHMVFLDSSHRDDVRDARSPLGDRPRLVEDHRVDFAGALEGLAPLDENAELRALPGRHHDCRWNGETHRARAGDDEDGDARRERAHHATTEKEPRDEGGDGNHEHRRHEHAAHSVGETLNRRACALRLPHERDDARQGALLA